ncbi:ABC transporter substrate-binding protein [Caldibacillus lycopersici]|uniref:ABC transporter substrate-binding protein n=1 Tax=Perspicuibacillus lycopersici TaxID=1325689 RepID=A0AAE3IQL5_9BACI|nr:ABC transporter substrate-binding protein [Perspicuibacillus lycopersici]MCU9612601.1 ABC transporter substrate-binding protein [Perspicuibacillus lycopersici]
MKFKKRVLTLLMVMIAFALVLTGCTDKSSSGNQNESGNESSSGETKPLIIGLSPAGQWQENFNPFSNTAMGGTNGLIYQSLWYFDNVSGQEYPMLATEYEWTNDNTTLVAKLRQNAKWSDGEAFTADDVVFTFQLLKDYPAADTSGIWAQVTSVEKQDDYTVAFNFDQANVPFQSYVLGSLIVPEHIWKDLGDPSKVQVTDPVGTGPYVLSSFTSQLYKMVKNENHYDADKYVINELQFPAFSGNDSEQLALAKGEIDWAGIFIPDAENVFVAQDPDHNHFWFPASNNVTLYPNLKNPILSDVAVRKAISLAIDRQKLSDQAASGYDPLPSTTALILPRDEKWIDPSIPKDQLEFELNVDKAVQTLEDAGYKKGSDGIFVSPDGEKLSFTLQTVSGWTDWATMAQLISQSLTSMGIEVTVDMPEYATYATNVQNGEYDLAISWTNAGPDPYRQYQDMLNSNGSWNLQQWSDPKTDEALQNYQSTTDEEVQRESIYYLQNVMVEHLPTIPLVNGPVWYEYRTENFVGWPTEENPYVNPAPFNWPAPAITISNLKPAN